MMMIAFTTKINRHRVRRPRCVVTSVMALLMTYTALVATTALLLHAQQLFLSSSSSSSSVPTIVVGAASAAPQQQGSSFPSSSSSIPRNPLASPHHKPSSSRSSSSSSWWDGSLQGDEDDSSSEEPTKGKDSSASAPTASGGGYGPLLQVPCGLILTGLVPNNSNNNNNNGGGGHGDEQQQVWPLTKVVVDTSSTHSLLHSRVLERYPKLKALLKSSPSLSSSYVLPPGLLSLRMDDATLEAPMLWIVDDEDSDGDDDGVIDLRLGLDVLRSHQAVIDIGQEELRLVVAVVNNNNDDDDKEKDKKEDLEEVVVTVPFVRPRPTLQFGTTGGGDDEL